MALHGSGKIGLMAKFTKILEGVGTTKGTIIVRYKVADIAKRIISFGRNSMVT